MKTAQRLLLLLVLALLLFAPRNIFSCGPFFEEATFSYNPHPDYPMKNYLAGKLGVVKPTFYRVFLVVAYRELSGHPLTPSEQATLEPLLTEEAQAGDVETAYGFEDLTPPTRPTPPTPSAVWVTERAQALGEPVPQNLNLDPNLNWGTYETFLNCPNPAFITAVETLRDREKKWGTKSDDVRTWIAGQDVVFSRCSKRQDAMPSSITTSNKLLQQDRDYQIAAALFYSGVPDQLVQAQQRFDAIGQDKTSPWHTWAPYLAARSLIRASTLKSNDEHVMDAALMTEAEARLHTIVASPDLAQTHRASQQILGFVEARLHPQQRTREIAHTLMAGTSSDILQDLLDYRFLLDRDEANAEVRRDDLTDWIRTFQSAGDKDHAIAKWRETGSLPWLIAALNVVDGKDVVAKDLLAAAAKLDPHDPRLLTAFYRRVTLLRNMHDEPAARALIDANANYLAKGAPISSRNLLWHERMELATGFDDFLVFAPREDASAHKIQSAPNPQTNAPPGSPNDVYFDTDASAILNRGLPVAVMAQAASSPKLPKPLQAEVAEAAWVRALLLDQPAVAAQLAPTVKRATPAIDPAIVAYERAASFEERHRAAIFAMLHNPGMRPYVVPNMQRTTEMNRMDHLRDNWWCEDVGANTSAAGAAFAGSELPANKTQRPPAVSVGYLSSAQRSAAAAEWDNLSSIGAAPTYFGREVLAWAKAAPDDPRVPEALHFVVRATRYGCSDDKTSSYSKQAFQLLHAKYLKSEWTRRTPYHF